MADDHAHGLLGSDPLDIFDQDDLERELQSTASKASSTRLPRCAVLNFQKVGDCVNMRPRAVTDTAGIAARIRTNDFSSFMLEEHSSRALNFRPSASDTAPISFRSDAVGKWTTKPVRRSYLDGEDSFSSLIISASDTTGASEGSSVSSGDTGSGERGSKSAEERKRHAHAMKTSNISTSSKPSTMPSRRNSIRSKSKARKNRLSREKSAMSRFLAFVTRKSPSKTVPAESSKQAAQSRKEKLTPASSVSSMEIPSQLFGKSRKPMKVQQNKSQATKNASTSCFPYAMRDEKEHKSEVVDRTDSHGPPDAYDSFTVRRKKSQWKVGRTAV